MFYLHYPIIALYSPYPQAGKSTIANIIAYQFGAQRMSFAEPLHNFVMNIAGPEAYGNKEAPLDFLNGLSVRDLLIGFGQAGRALDPELWVNVMQNRLESRDMPVVVDDLRFPNEYNMLAEQGAWFVRISVPGREIQRSETEALLENANMDIELINAMQSIDELREHLATTLKPYFVEREQNFQHPVQVEMGF